MSITAASVHQPDAQQASRTHKGIATSFLTHNYYENWRRSQHYCEKPTRNSFHSLARRLLYKTHVWVCGRWNNRVWLRHTAGSFLETLSAQCNKVSNSRQDARGCCFWTNRRPLPAAATRSNARFYAAAQWVRRAHCNPSMAYARIHQPHKGHTRVSECAAPAISGVVEVLCLPGNTITTRR